MKNELLSVWAVYQTLGYMRITEQLQFYFLKRKYPCLCEVLVPGPHSLRGTAQEGITVRI